MKRWMQFSDANANVNATLTALIMQNHNKSLSHHEEELQRVATVSHILLYILAVTCDKEINTRTV